MEVKEPIILPTLDTEGLKKISWSTLKLGKVLGEGGYGIVSKGRWHGIEVAIKQLHLNSLPEHLLEEFENEANIMSECQFPNVVRLYGICVESGHYAMVMEYMAKGSLYQVLQKKTSEVLPWNPLRWQMAIDIGRGLAYLHSQKILHRDLKSSNVLLDQDYRAKIGDFGLSKIKVTTTNASTKHKNVMGTTRWRAPELFKRGCVPNFSTDIYSYGMVLWEIATRRLPFEDAADDVTAMGWIKDGEQEKIPEDCPVDYGKIIQSCWGKPKGRPASHQVLLDLEQCKPATPIEKKDEFFSLEEPKAWHFDAAIKENVVLQEPKDYVLVPATDLDKQKVAALYQHHAVPGYDLASVEVIYNTDMNREFVLYLNKLQKRDHNPAFAPQWQTQAQDDEKEKAWRVEVNQLFEALATPYQDSTYPAVKLLPLWHGTKSKVLDSLFKTGYANLATTDSGFFGKGIYGTYEAEYAYRVYSRGALILNWVAIFSAYPTIHADMDMLKDKGNYANYDAHFVPVVPISNKPTDNVYIPCKPHQMHQYIEVVVFQSAACLPRYLVTLQPRTLVPLKSSGKSAYQTGQKLLLARQYAQALPHLEESAQKSYPPAYLALGFLYEFESLIGTKDSNKSQQCYQKVSEAIDWFQAQALTGAADAQNNLGFCYYQGLGVPQNFFLAVKYYLLAADQGDISAQNSLALCYEQGKGVQRDYARAVQYYRRAAEQGHATAQLNLGLCYQQGQGVAANSQQAFHYFSLAADQGNANAQYLVGYCYQTGVGVIKEMKLALNYFRLAAQQGHVEAQQQLALYESASTHSSSFFQSKQGESSTPIQSPTMGDNSFPKKENCLIM